MFSITSDGEIYFAGLHVGSIELDRDESYIDHRGQHVTRLRFVAAGLDLVEDASALNEVFSMSIASTSAKRRVRGIVSYEAVCKRCGEHFNPADEHDLIHLYNVEHGVECGGYGVLLGGYR